MGFYSTHQWKNGAVSTVERLNEDINIKVQDENEKMVTDIVMGEYEALCLAHSILSVVTNPGDNNV